MWLTRWIFGGTGYRVTPEEVTLNLLSSPLLSTAELATLAMPRKNCSNPSANQRQKALMSLAVDLTFGTAIGVGIGLILSNLPLGIGIGLAMGTGGGGVLASLYYGGDLA